MFRHFAIFLSVVSLLSLASPSEAQQQIILNDGLDIRIPGVAETVTLYPNLTVRANTFGPAPNGASSAISKRRAVHSGPAAPAFPFQGAVSNDGCSSEFFVAMYPSIPKGSVVEEFIDDKLTFSGPINLVGEQFVHGWMWKQPGDCSGNHSYHVVATTPDFRRYRATAPMAMPEGVPHVDLVVDGQGGVLFLGPFLAPLTVVAPRWLASPVDLQGGNYIPPGAVGHGETTLIICPARAGNLADLYCQTISKELK